MVNVTEATQGAAWPYALALLTEASDKRLRLTARSYNTTLAACDKGPSTSYIPTGSYYLHTVLICCISWQVL